MGTIINLINASACFWLAVSACMFYIILYGDGSQVVYRWPLLQHWMLKVGLVGIITGAVINAVSWNHVGWSGAMLNSGVACVFHWAYLYHRRVLMQGGNKQG